MADQMAEAHKRDYRAHDLIDAAVFALSNLQGPDATTRLHQFDLVLVKELSDRLQERAAQIVRTWD